MRNHLAPLFPIADSLARRAHLIAMALFAIVGIAVLDDYGIAADEVAQWANGNASLSYILGDEGALRGEDEPDRYYGVAFELSLIVVERLLGLEDTRHIHLVRHLLTHIFFLTAGFFAWLLAYRLFGSRLIALLAMLIFLLHPRIYAHSFFNTKDLPFLSMFMVALYLTHRAFRRDSVWAFALCGVGAGLLMNIRVMGVILPPAVLCMLALDALHAAGRAGWGGLKPPLIRAGAFTAASAATLYATWPLLWRDPLELAEAFRALSRHPVAVQTLFRGEWVRWPNIPWDYIPAWALATTPPVALILAALGTAFVVYLCAARWRGMFANSAARFGLLAVACLILPVAAVIALNSNVYNGWRQMYFLYAPLCVLAAFGLRFIMALPKPRLRAAAFALAALGIAAAIAQMVSLHPYQQDYFSPLADKSALADRWELDYWHVSRRHALERTLSMQPTGRVSVNSCDLGGHFLERNLRIIPREDRVRTVINRFSPDFLICQAVANPAWTREIYGASVVSLADNRESARRAYMDAYALAKSREPDFKAHFDVHVADGLIVYLREPCSEDGVAGTFTISERPVHPDAIPDFTPDDSESFGFWDYGRILGGACVMARRAPDYPLASLKIAYRPPNQERELWSAEIPVNNHLKAYEAAMRSEPLAQSGFDIHQDGGTLIYVKTDCSESDARGRFALTAHPVDLADLPPSARRAGADSESLNFDFWRHGAMFDGKCVAVRRLPDYPISHVETAQWIPGEGGLWSARIPFAGYYDRFRDALSALSGDPAASAGGFDMYEDGGTLTYVKSPCAEDDARGRFALTVHPVDQSDLPQDVQDAGADSQSLNFDFAEHGAAFDGKCVAIRELPDYPISHVATAQWVPGEGGLWSVRIPFAGYYERFRDALSELSGETPAASAGGFDMYLDGGTLTYVKIDCDEYDTRGRFALTAHPVDRSDLPQDVQDAGADSESLNFDFAEHGAAFDGACVAIRELPDYPISHVATAQWIPGEGGLWSARIPFAGYYERFRDALSELSGETPAASAGGFDIYEDGGTLTYLKTTCGEGDTLGRFALRVYPVNLSDLPQAAQDAGADNESLNFDFAEHGAIVGGECIIIRELPDYPISHVRTGQWIPGGSELWRAVIPVGN